MTKALQQTAPQVDIPTHTDGEMYDIVHIASLEWGFNFSGQTLIGMVRRVQTALAKVARNAAMGSDKQFTFALQQETNEDVVVAYVVIDLLKSCLPTEEGVNGATTYVNYLTAA